MSRYYELFHVSERVNRSRSFGFTSTKSRRTSSHLSAKERSSAFGFTSTKSRMTSSHLSAKERSSAFGSPKTNLDLYFYKLLTGSDYKTLMLNMKYENKSAKTRLLKHTDKFLKSIDEIDELLDHNENATAATHINRLMHLFPNIQGTIVENVLLGRREEQIDIISSKLRELNKGLDLKNFKEQEKKKEEMPRKSPPLQEGTFMEMDIPAEVEYVEEAEQEERPLSPQPLRLIPSEAFLSRAKQLGTGKLVNPSTCVIS